MIFIKEAFISFIWLFKVLNAFLKVQPLITILVILLETLSRVLHVAAFLLPIKVILLVGSDRVPRYFRSFIDLDEKMTWVMGLALASVVFYLLTLIIDAINNKLSITGAQKVVGVANDMVVFSRQEEKAKDYYGKITSISSKLLFILLSAVILYFINVKIMMVFFALVAALFIMTGLILSIKQGRGMISNIYMPQNSLAKWIINQ